QEQAEGLLPVALLREQNLDIGLTAGSLEVITYPVRQLRLAATARSGLVTVSELRGNIEGGSFSLPMTIDVRAAKPQISLSPVLKDIDLGPIAKRSLEQDVFTGRMNFNGSVKVSGNSVDEWVKTAQGPNTLRLNEGLIKGINIGDALLNALGQYQALLPALTGRDAASIQGRKIRDTEIVSLLGEVSLNQGIVKNESMKADLKDIQVGGSGTYNLETQAVDYRFQLKLDRKFWGERYAKMAEYPIPVRCNGSLKGSLATLCGLDSQGMQGLVAQMAQARVAEEVDRGKQQLQERLNEKIGDKLDPVQQEAVKQLFDVFKR
ncbi:MAG: AsmA-like C-terminal region-containing protein, partial [Moraxellaceae bacterium]|nr:AsmA-like C-terminal region-containing protein [Moraxellaceae bacterium]